MKGIIKEFGDEVPIIFAETAGFRGSSYDGYEILLNAFIEQTVKEKPKKEKLVNVIGIVPSLDVFWEGNLVEIERILNGIGLEVNTLFNDKKIEDLSAAALNIVLSPWVGVKAAKKLEKRYETPYIVNPIPIGSDETNLFLERVGEALDIDVNEFTSTEEAKTYKSIEKVRFYYRF